MKPTTTTKIKTTWDVVVIGGGPAGMMAAGRAAELGRSVLLLEKNHTLGKKLLTTGGGRCNLTNNKTEIRAMLAKYKGSAKFLFSAFSQFSAEDTLAFFNQRGMATKEEAEGRIFPVSNTAQSVWNVLLDYMKKGGVQIQTKTLVSKLSYDAKKGRVCVHMDSKIKEIYAQSCVIATGGTSRPETGSTGEGLMWLKKLGHTVVNNNVALVPVALSDAWVKKLGGVTLKDVKLTIFQNEKKQKTLVGKILFTHFGISGPTVLNMSKEIGDLLEYGMVMIMLDVFPHHDHGALKDELHTLLTKESNKKIKNALAKLLPPAFVPALLDLAKIKSDTPSHSVTSKDRTRLVTLLKSIPLHVSGLLGHDKAVVSSGGVTLEEVNFKTMQSRVVPQIYLVGDMLNIDRPSGGYSLQLCWTTGFVAGNNA